MHPEVNHDLAIKMQAAVNALRALEEGMKELGTDDICKKFMNDRTMQQSSGYSPEIDDINNICQASNYKK